jgi:tRNA(fMet)-specific endonuclease VapC
MPGQALRWLLDTNTVSEAVKRAPDVRVANRLTEHRDTVAIPATVLQELRFGWLRMPEGRQKRVVGDYLQQTVEWLPVLPLDAAAARLQAEVRAEATAVGRPLSYPDSEIAAIAIAHGLTLVTRNLRDFSDRPGLRVANWFQP